MGGDVVEDAGLRAGAFAGWLAEVEGAMRGERASEVPCGDCTACCTSSQFVHIAPDEADALAHIPADLRFPAPGLPPGHVLLGYDERGRCPMLRADGCSVYEHRPRTCRTYDCRVFPAAGVTPDDKPLIAARARRWRFDHDGADDRVLHDAVLAAGACLRSHPEVLPGRAVPTPTQRAVLAVEVHRVFLEGSAPDPEAVRVELGRRRRG